MTYNAFGFGYGPGEGWWWGPRQRRRGRRRWFESGDMKYVILKLLRDKPMHGYEVMKALEEQTHGCYKPSPGTVYPTLQWLEDEGLVKSEEVEGKKVYGITEAGRAFLEEHRGTVDDIFERVEETIESLFSDPLPEVTRLAGRLVSQAYRATWKLREDKDRQRRVLDVLERATKELEEVLAEPTARPTSSPGG